MWGGWEPRLKHVIVKPSSPPSPLIKTDEKNVMVHSTFQALNQGIKCEKKCIIFMEHSSSYREGNSEGKILELRNPKVQKCRKCKK